jgi:beta-lactamase regulating signal transducer with metallopeptidase domain
MLPVVLAAIATFSLRRSTAESRMLVWRSAAVTLLAVYVGRQLPLHGLSWGIPSALAAPLIALGRVQVTAATLPSVDAPGTSIWLSGSVQLLLLAYVAGVTMVLLPSVVGWVRVQRMKGRARPVHDVAWSTTLADVRTGLGLRRSIRLFVSDETLGPMTWGLFRPVVMLPESADAWNDSQRRIVLMHELSHVRAGDWLFSLAARLACALYWFHPGVWWIARRLHEDCERACDDRVIASGVRRSDYADLLIDAADHVHAGTLSRVSALALSTRDGLRGRLSAVLDTRHDVRPVARGWVAVAAIAAMIVAAPASSVQLAPTRDTLTSLMRDARWESRAYAVLGLAQRPDSIAVARSAAELDPSPRVRAWARYALGDAEPAELRAIIRHR